MKKAEEVLEEVFKLREELKEIRENEAKAREELTKHFSQIIENQREEITRLRKKIHAEHQDRRIRLAKALTQFNGE